VESRAVEVTDGGFRVGDTAADGTGSWMETRLRPASDAAPAPAEDPGPKFDANGVPPTPAQKKIASVQESMDEIIPEYSNEMGLQMLADYLTGETPPVELVKTIVPPENSSGSPNENEEVGHDGGQRL